MKKKKKTRFGKMSFDQKNRPADGEQPEEILEEANREAPADDGAPNAEAPGE